LTADDAIAFVHQHGIVLASARGPVPRLTEAIAGEPIKGSWWGHPKSHLIFAVLERLTDSPDILTCRLVDGKVTFVHRRLWPALARIADQFHPDRISQVREQHTPSGHHVRHEIAFPKWVPGEVLQQAQALTPEQARAALQAVLARNAAGSRSIA
jgi:hypothetical protein